MTIGLSHYLTVAAILFTLGIFGIFLNRKNVIVILMSIELMLLAVNINLVAFSAFHGDLVGGLYTVADRMGYELALSAVTPGRDEQRAVGSLLQDRCEALVLLGPQAPTAYLARIVRASSGSQPSGSETATAPASSASSAARSGRKPGARNIEATAT